MSTSPAKVLFAAGHRWGDYEAPLRAAFAEAGIIADISPEMPPGEVEYVIYGPAKEGPDLSAMPHLKAVLSLWAGVERVIGDVPPGVPLARMVDEGLTRGMVEYVVAHVLRHHIGLDAHVVNPGRDWTPVMPPIAPERVVTILGLGELGRASAEALVALGFDMRGWSRNLRDVPGVACFSGAEGLARALDGAEIVVLLLPHTAETVNTLDAAALARLAPGAAIINPGRGPLIDDGALLAALDSGQVGHATLDTFRQEPLPKDHPFWSHPRVTVTPHIASETRPRTAARAIAENLRRAIAGEPLLNQVDRTAGY